MSTEETETNEVDEETEGPDHQHQLRVLDVFVVEETLQSFHEDGEAESNEEDRVDESPEHLRSRPAICVLLRLPP